MNANFRLTMKSLIYILHPITRRGWRMKEDRIDLMAKVAQMTLVAALCVISLARGIFAAEVTEIYDLSFTLTEEGINRMQLNSANWYKGVRIDVTKRQPATIQQYEISQQVIEPLRKRDNPTEAIRTNFVMRRLTDTAPAGSFNIQSSDVVVSSVGRIYTSDAAGASVSFTLVYGIDRLQDLAPGDYTSQVSFVLRPVGGGTATGVIIKNLYIDAKIPEDLSGVPTIEITPLTGLSTITLNSRKEGMQAFDVGVKISQPPRGAFALTQILAEPLQSPEGSELDPKDINFVVKEAARGRPTDIATPLSSGKTTLYRADSGASVDDAFIITYSIGDLSGAKAGRYRGRILYYLEEIGRPVEFKGSLGIELNNESIVELEITPEQGGAIAFTNLKPSDTPRTNEVAIAVKTNLGKKYQLNQNVLQELTDSSGNMIPFDLFTMRTESTETKGALRFLDRQPVKRGDMILFVSDDSGSSDKFKVIYELKVPLQIRAGDYSTRITYSLLEK